MELYSPSMPFFWVSVLSVSVVGTRCFSCGMSRSRAPLCMALIPPSLTSLLPLARLGVWGAAKEHIEDFSLRPLFEERTHYTLLPKPSHSACSLVTAPPLSPAPKGTTSGCRASLRNLWILFFASWGGGAENAQ